MTFTIRWIAACCSHLIFEQHSHNLLLYTCTKNQTKCHILWLIDSCSVTPGQPLSSYQGRTQLIKSQVKSHLRFLSRVILCHAGGGPGKSEVEWAGKQDIRKTEFLATGEACKVLFSPSPSFKFNQWTWVGLNFYICSTPLRVAHWADAFKLISLVHLLHPAPLTQFQSHGGSNHNAFLIHNTAIILSNFL